MRMALAASLMLQQSSTLRGEQESLWMSLITSLRLMKPLVFLVAKGFLYDL